MDGKTTSGVRLTEVLAAVSLGTDLGMGHPMEHVLRQSFIALRLAERLGLDAPARQVVYYSSLLAWIGCHVDAYEQAKWFGDDLVLKHDTLDAPGRHRSGGGRGDSDRGSAEGSRQRGPTLGASRSS